MTTDAHDFSMTLKAYAKCRCGKLATHFVPWSKERVEEARRKAEARRAERERKKRENMSLREINERLADAARPMTGRETITAILTGCIERPCCDARPGDHYCDDCWRTR